MSGEVVSTRPTRVAGRSRDQVRRRRGVDRRPPRALEDGRATERVAHARLPRRIDGVRPPGHRDRAQRARRDEPRRARRRRASDARRARGEVLGPLDGIPYTAKDSYLVRGLTAAAGSPAFEHLVAQRDAFTIERLRAAGAVLHRPHEHAADGERRHAARRLRPRREPPTTPTTSRPRSARARRTARAPRPRRRSRRSGSARRPGRRAARPRRTTRCAPTRPRAASSRCAATGRSCRRWTSSCRTRAPWPTCSRCST